MNIPADLKYTKDHEWLREDGSLVIVGITAHAQDQLGDVVFVDLPAVGTQLVAGKTFGTVESVKAVSDLYAPLSGEVIEVNAALSTQPELVNKDPYQAAWMVKLAPADKGDLSGLLSADEYAKLV